MEIILNKRLFKNLGMNVMTRFGRRMEDPSLPPEQRTYIHYHNDTSNYKRGEGGRTGDTRLWTLDLHRSRERLQGHSVDRDVDPINIEE